MDCGPTCLRIACPVSTGVAKYYGRHYNADTLRKKGGFSKAGVSLLCISERIGSVPGGSTFLEIFQAPLIVEIAHVTLGLKPITAIGMC